jgi:hypothetical protein
MMNWLDNYRTISVEEFEFYTEISESNMKQVFIIGSSQITGVNATLIEKITKEKNPEYSVYNLGKSADRPNTRVKTFDYIIESKPEILVFGIGHRDFHPTRIYQENFGIVKDETGIFLQPKKVIEEYILAPLNFYKTNYDFLNDPHTSTWRSISGSMDKIRNSGFEGILLIINDSLPSSDNSFSLLLEYPNQKQYFPNSPFFFHKPDSIWHVFRDDMTSENISTQCDKIDMIQDFSVIHNSNYISLINMIEESKKNDIEVVLFSTPIHPICLKQYEEQTYLFENMLLDIQEQFDVKVVFLHDKYEKDGMWYYADHVTQNSNSKEFSLDIADIILELI